MSLNSSFRNHKFQFLLEKLPKDPEAWTKLDVVEWLQIIKMDQYAPHFQELGVDGWLILDLDEDDLKNDLQISIKLHRKKILKGAGLPRWSQPITPSHPDPQEIPKVLGR